LEIGVNVALASTIGAAAEGLSKKFGPLAGQTVALAPLLALLARRPVRPATTSVLASAEERALVAETALRRVGLHDSQLMAIGRWIVERKN
jgi:hypothetical protein